MIRSSADTVAPHAASEWKPITNPDRGLFLVTNNMNARWRDGSMSHAWLTDAIHVGTGTEGPFWCYAKDDMSMLKVQSLTHYAHVRPAEDKS